jgi:hypothetical protein
VRLVGIHRGFIARCYRRVCPAVTMCKAESCTTAAGFVLQTVKHRQACYKREGVHTSLRHPYVPGVYLGCIAKRQLFVISPVDGRFLAGELTRRDPRFWPRAR